MTHGQRCSHGLLSRARPTVSVTCAQNVLTPLRAAAQSALQQPSDRPKSFKQLVQGPLATAMHNAFREYLAQQHAAGHRCQDPPIPPTHCQAPPIPPPTHLVCTAASSPPTHLPTLRARVGDADGSRCCKEIADGPQEVEDCKWTQQIENAGF